MSTNTRQTNVHASLSPVSRLHSRMFRRSIANGWWWFAISVSTLLISSHEQNDKRPSHSAHPPSIFLFTGTCLSSSQCTYASSPNRTRHSLSRDTNFTLVATSFIGSSPRALASIEYLTPAASMICSVSCASILCSLSPSLPLRAQTDRDTVCLNPSLFHWLAAMAPWE